jgi:hypothetical protein
MVQTAAFPRSFRSRGLTMDQVIESAVTDALLLEKAGVDGLLLQDLGQLPRRDTVDIVDVARFSIVCSNVTTSVGLPIGINCVWNAWEETLAIATAVEAQFVRFKTYVGASLTPFGFINGCAAEVAQFISSSCSVKPLIFADIQDRNSTPITQQALEREAYQALKMANADAVLIEGTSTSDTIRKIEDIKKFVPEAIVLIGGGVSIDTVQDLIKFADGIIVKTCLTEDGNIESPPNFEIAAKFMEKVNQARKNERVPRSGI